MRSPESSFLEGAFLLTFASVLAKVLGALARIPLYLVLGSEGMGLFQMAYPIYTLLLTASTSGTSVAISKLIAEKVSKKQLGAARMLLNVSLSLLLVTGAGMAVALYLSAPWIAQHVARDSRAVWPIRAMSPSLLLVSVMAAFRGFFQGLENMVPTATSQILEQMGRLAAMLTLAVLLMDRGLEYAAAGAAAGTTVGSCIALAYIGLTYARRGRVAVDGSLVDEEAHVSGSLFELLRVAVPVSIASTMFGLTEIIDLTLVPSRLQSLGVGPEESTRLYGRLSGGALPLANLPTVFTNALAISLVPSIASASARRDPLRVTRRASKAVTLTYCLALPASVGLYVLARPVPRLLYGDEEVSVVLRPLTPGILFLAMQQISTAILQGLGLVMVPVVGLLCSGAVKFVLTWFLVGHRSFGIAGASLATTAYFLTSCVFNFCALRKRLGNLLDLRRSAGASFSATVMALCVGGTYRLLVLPAGPAGATFLSVLCGMLVYGILALVTRSIDMEDVLAIPGLGSLIIRGRPK